jgi:hypothetical protein
MAALLTLGSPAPVAACTPEPGAGPPFEQVRVSSTVVVVGELTAYGPGSTFTVHIERVLRGHLTGTSVGFTDTSLCPNGPPVGSRVLVAADPAGLLDIWTLNEDGSVFVSYPPAVGSEPTTVEALTAAFSALPGTTTVPAGPTDSTAMVLLTGLLALASGVVLFRRTSGRTS